MDKMLLESMDGELAQMQTPTRSSHCETCERVGVIPTSLTDEGVGEEEDAPCSPDDDAESVSTCGTCQSREERASRKRRKVLIALATLGCLFFGGVFQCGLGVLGTSCSIVFNKQASGMLAEEESVLGKPAVGLTSGSLGTMLFQSSSVSTSIVVKLVDAGHLGVKSAIPVIMGANVGSTATSIVVALGTGGKSGKSYHPERAIAVATAHYLFNILTVAILLPLEEIMVFANGYGGLLFLVTEWLAGKSAGLRQRFTLSSSGGYSLSSLFIDVNEDILENIELRPYYQSLDKVSPKPRCMDHKGRECSAVWCLSKAAVDYMLDFEEALALDEFRKVAKILTCVDPSPELCASGDLVNNCYTGDIAAEFKARYLVDGGILKNVGSAWHAGIAGICVSVVLVAGSLHLTIGLAKFATVGWLKKLLMFSMELNMYWAVGIGIVWAMLTSSSSAVVASLTVVTGLGVISMEKAFAVVVGASIGTTTTAVYSALSISHGNEPFQAALCHVLFNFFGMTIWFLIPRTRRVPLVAAEVLGAYSAKHRWLTVCYLLVVSFVAPSIAFALAKFCATHSAQVARPVEIATFMTLSIAASLAVWFRVKRGQARDSQRTPPLDQPVNDEEPPENREVQLAEL